MKGGKRIGILLADDHAILREGLKNLLSSENDMTVVAEVSDGRSAIELARTLNPDVIIMDVGMPNLNGIEATRQIVAAHPSVRLIALSALADRRYVSGMLHAGAMAYVIKSAAGDDLVKAIRCVLRNRTFISPEIAQSAFVPAVPPGSDDFLPRLSQREREILQRLAEGQTSNQIAIELGISTRTVETHRRNIMKKLDLHNLADLTRYAIREGLIQAE